MSDVNGIPTAGEFKKHIGRTGISKAFKKTDLEIDALLSTLQNAEYWRNVPTPDSLRPLRMVRKACIAWMLANMDGTRASRPHIKKLCGLIHLRINDVIESNFARTSTFHQMNQVRGGMASVHDQIRLRRGGGLVGRALDGHYSIERNSGTHLPKGSGSKAAMKHKQSGSKLTLEDWVQHVLIPQAEEDPFGMFFDQAGQLDQLSLQEIKTKRVKYCTPKERGDYELTIKEGLIYDANGELYHTSAKETAFSGLGWAIYVVDFDHQFYSNSHIVNVFHHSSFLSGAPVQAAGELAVNQGRLVAITNKTGHYQAGPAELRRALEILKDAGVDLATVKANDPFRAKDLWFTGTVALSANGEVAKLSSKDAVTPPEKVKD